MKEIYFDNASTSFPKPEKVGLAVANYINHCGMNVSRSSYEASYQAGELVLETRELVCRLFDFDKAANVCFTANITESLNILLKGFLKKGDHVLVSGMEHNAIMRPLTQLEKEGVSFSRIPCKEDGSLLLEEFEKLMVENTRLCVMTHASNVCGTLLPIKEVGELCQRHGIAFFVDSAQSAGHLPISMKECHIDALAFTGHKGLLGPMGIGGFVISDHLVPQIEPLISGGTGSISHTEDIPAFMPDRFEAGTLNLPGIAGLNASLKWLMSTSLETIRQKEEELTSYFLSGLAALDPEEKHVRLYGLKDPLHKNRTGVISLGFPGQELSEIAYRLDSEYHILTRLGLHCAPSAHKTLGSFPEGSLRFSLGYFNTREEIDTALAALKEILSI